MSVPHSLLIFITADTFKCHSSSSSMSVVIIVRGVVNRDYRCVDIPFCLHVIVKYCVLGNLMACEMMSELINVRLVVPIKFAFTVNVLMQFSFENFKTFADNKILFV